MNIKKKALNFLLNLLKLLVSILPMMIYWIWDLISDIGLVFIPGSEDLDWPWRWDWSNDWNFKCSNCRNNEDRSD